MYCKYCGKEIDDNSIFCPSCHKTFNDNALTPDKQTLETSNSNLRPANSKKNEIGIALSSFILGILSIILFYFSYIALPCAILAIYFGKFSIKQKIGGKEYAKFGIKLGSIAIIILVAFIIIAIAVSILFKFKISVLK